MPLPDFRVAGRACFAAALCALTGGSVRLHAAATAPFDLVNVPTRFVLTGNPGPGDVPLGVNVTYTATPPFENPADPQNHRLIDNDPVNDWNSTAGINFKDQTVTFDLQQNQRLDEAALLFDQPQKPASVTVAVADAATGPWREVGTLRLEDQKDPWWRLPLAGTGGRFVQFACKLKDWGWYLREVRIYGSPSISVGPVVRTQGQLVLADQMGPHATIVVADRTFSNALRAAALFQRLARELTGVLLPLVPESKFDGKGAAIFIGDSQLARANGVTVQQTPFGDERYELRTGQNWLALVGNDARPNAEPARGSRPFCGSIFAVYDFFERHGCGWFGPDPLWQVLPKVPTLAAEALAVSEVPAFSMRDLWLFPLEDPAVREPWRLGGLSIKIGHAYNDLVPPGKYQAQHPDWFGENQPDITNPEVIRVAVENLGAQLDARPDEPIVTFSVGCNDAGGFKDPPFNPRVGNIAAQELYFTNEIAKGLRKTHPQRRFLLQMFAYWHSHEGPVPMLKGEPEVQIFLVNQGNHAKPLDLPEDPNIARTTGRNNTIELAALAAWKKTGQLNSIYEWWIPSLANPAWKDTPWYDGDTAVRNLRLWRREGIRNLTYEIQGENNAGFPLRWAQYYIGARAMWNPQIDPHKVLLEACGKLFGPAAPDMTKFYELQQAAMRETKERGGNWSLPAPHLLYPARLEAAGDALLAQAAKNLDRLPPDRPERKRVDIERATWKRLHELNVVAREKAGKTYTVVLDGRKMDYTGSTIDAAAVRSLFGISDKAQLEAVERDGQNRPALPGETYDLEGGITFRTAPKAP